MILTARAHTVQVLHHPGATGQRPWLRVSLIAITLMLGLFYLLQTNAVASKGYEVSRLRSHVNELKRINRDLQLQATEMQSLKYVQQTVATAQFVPNDRLEYLAGIPAQPGVAVK